MPGLIEIWLKLNENNMDLQSEALIAINYQLNCDLMKLYDVIDPYWQSTMVPSEEISKFEGDKCRYHRYMTLSVATDSVPLQF